MITGEEASRRAGIMIPGEGEIKEGRDHDDHRQGEIKEGKSHDPTPKRGERGQVPTSQAHQVDSM